MTNYTTNIAQNPGLQLGLSGYSGISNATIQQSALGTGGTLLGNPGLLVTTPGVVSGEGVLTPASTVQSTTTHSVSVYIQGTVLPATVTVYAISNPGGVILGSVPVTLTNSYQRAVINNLPATSGNNISLLISTTGIEAIQFWIANVQIEPESPAHPYCDGGQPGCSWQTSVGGISFQQYQNTVSAISNIIDGSSVVNVLIIGEVFNVTVNPASINDYPGLISTVTAPGPVGAMTDFSVAALTDPDPALTYVSWNNAGLTVPTSGYNRSFGAFYPPQDYFVSNNVQLYKRAAYMAVGWQFSNVPNNATALLTDVQAEILPFTTGSNTAPSPSSYTLPREIQTIIKPNRLNYCTNPSFEVSTANWSAIAGGVISLDTTVSVGVISTIDDVSVGGGFNSLKVAISHSGDGAQITLSNLIAGDTYIASAYVQPNTNISDISLICANGSTSVVSGGSEGTGYGTGTYGGGYYGGNPPSSNTLVTGQWYRVFTTFQAADTSAVLKITGVTTASTNFWIDAVLVEPGQVLGTYFDGDFGSNYFWESGGTEGLARSYYYDQYAVKAQAVNNVLAHHTPFGISFATPVFLVPPTQ